MFVWLECLPVVWLILVFAFACCLVGFELLLVSGLYGGMFGYDRVLGCFVCLLWMIFCELSVLCFD